MVNLDTFYREPVQNCPIGTQVQYHISENSLTAFWQSANSVNSENTFDMNSMIISIKSVLTSRKFFERFLGYAVNIRRITRLLQSLLKVYGWYTFVYPVYTINNL